MRRTRLLVTAVSVTVLVVAAMVAVYAFGTPQAPTSPIAQSAVVPEADPSSPLAIQVPGCVCHSDDPAVVEEHAQYRMNQCFGCHSEGVPEMAR